MQGLGNSILFRGHYLIAPGGATPVVDHSTMVKVMQKVLDFDQLGGPECTVDGTVFEMWLGHY